MKAIFLSCLILVSLISCNNRNKLHIDENELIAEMLAGEQEKPDNNSSNYGDFQIGKNTLIYQSRYEPERTVDPQNPPEIIDIAGNMDHFKEFNLSDIVNDIQYIRLEQTTDSAFLGPLQNDPHVGLGGEEASKKEEVLFTILKNENYIVAYNTLGMLLYDINGKILGTVCTNEFTGFTLSKHSSAHFTDYTFKGANGTPRLSGDKLYYNYEDNVNKISRMMEVDCSSLPAPAQQNNESNGQISGIGQPVANTGENPNDIVKLGDNLFLNRGNPGYGNDMITIFNSIGDTICSFPANQIIDRNFGQATRYPDWGSSFLLDDEYYFREALSDTIFEVSPPNRLVPSFIINLGEYKVEKIQEARDPSFDLSNKFTIQSISVTGDYVFICYNKGYNSIRSRNTKTVKFYYAIYDRANNELWHLPADPDNAGFVIENDIDGGLPVWPGKFLEKYIAMSVASEEGKILYSVKGIDLKRYVKSDEFKNSPAPESKKSELETLASTTGDFETIVIVMK